MWSGHYLWCMMGGPSQGHIRENVASWQFASNMRNCNHFRNSQICLKASNDIIYILSDLILFNQIQTKQFTESATKCSRPICNWDACKDGFGRKSPHSGCLEMGGEGPRGECQTLSVTFTLRTSLKDVRGHSNRTSGDIPTGCPAMFYFCIFTWYLWPLCIYMNSTYMSDSCDCITCL